MVVDPLVVLFPSEPSVSDSGLAHTLPDVDAMHCVEFSHDTDLITCLVEPQSLASPLELLPHRSCSLHGGQNWRF